MKILHVLNDFPYPPNHGGRVDMWGRLQALTELGHEVHAIVTVKERPSNADLSQVRRLVKKLDLVERSRIWTGLVHRQPLQILSRKKLAHLDLTDRYGAVISEAEFCYPIFENPQLRTERKIIRVHNDEARFMAEMASIEPSWFRRKYFESEVRRFQEFSPEAFDAVDELWFSSCDQQKQYVAEAGDPAGKGIWLPPPINSVRGHTEAMRSSRQVLFVGSLTARSNLEAIQWYLAAVHPKLRDIEGYRFMIAGSTRGEDLSSIVRRASQDPNCEVRVDVPDLRSLYESSGVFVNCMLHGASIKMKTVNAAQEGLPIVTTAVGNEGTGFLNGEHVCVANTPEEFAGAIRGLLTRSAYAHEIASRAQEFLRATYRHADQLTGLLQRVGAEV